jgi:hypothetical protein
MLLQKCLSVAKISIICLTRGFNLTSLLTQQLVKAGFLDVLWLSFSRLGLAGLAFALAACAPVEQKAAEQKPADVVVKERAQERWNLLVKGDLEAAYVYLSPGSREIKSLEQYVKDTPRNFWKSVVVQNAACTADSCEVGGTMEYEFQGRRMKTPYKEKWIREGSNWWFFAG